MPKPDYDVLAIGGGAAGLTVAIGGARIGLRTALVERHRVGGDCTWTGCVPSKAIVHVARVAASARTAASWRATAADDADGPDDASASGARSSLDFASVLAYVHGATSTGPALTSTGTSPPPGCTPMAAMSSKAKTRSRPTPSSSPPAAAPARRAGRRPRRRRAHSAGRPGDALRSPGQRSGR